MNIEFKSDRKLESKIAYFNDCHLKLESGGILKNFKIAFKTFGKLNDSRTNAILVCHALTGDQYVTGNNPITGRSVGGLEWLVQKPIDTEKFFVICSNVLGGCSGSTDQKKYLMMAIDMVVIFLL